MAKKTNGQQQKKIQKVEMLSCSSESESISEQEEFNENFEFAFDNGPAYKPKNYDLPKSVNILDELVAKKKKEIKDFSSSEEEAELEAEQEEEEQEEHQEEQDSGDDDDETNNEYFEENTAKTLTSFSDMNLSRPILKGLTSLGFIQPTKIQSVAIPVALLGKDICGGAVTGSGKTGAFAIPILERLMFRSRQAPLVRVLILLPTRELAVQCHQVVVDLAKFTDITACLAAGGMPMRQQEIELKKRPDIVVATPGRLIDHLRNSASFNLEHVEILVLDEADRMLDEGFTEELDEIVRYCPKSRQTMLFSATMTDKVQDLIRLSLNKPVKLFVDHNQSIVSKLTQEFVRIRDNREIDRIPIILALAKKIYKGRCIIFVPSKQLAHKIAIIFGLNDLKATELHGDLTQTQRLEALEKFKNNQADFLIATDLAARGLDISGVLSVINYSMPQDYRQYQHRVGRTARAGKSGNSCTLVGELDRKVMKLVIKNSQVSVKQRIISFDLVQKYRSRIQDLEPKIKEILAEEKEEKLLKKAEMEMNKATNLIEHEQEIHSRPAKTWFKTKKEKTTKRKPQPHSKKIR